MAIARINKNVCKLCKLICHPKTCKFTYAEDTEDTEEHPGTIVAIWFQAIQPWVLGTSAQHDACLEDSESKVMEIERNLVASGMR